MPVRSRWPLVALTLSLSLALVLFTPAPARAQTCEILSNLGACTPSEPDLEFNPDGTITLPGGSGSSGPSRPPPPSSPLLLPDAAADLLAQANQERARVGAPMLVSRPDVVQMAIAHTREMLGSNGGIFHNLDLLTKPLRNTLGALTVGENVGYSTNLDDLHARFMASPGHRAALLDPRFTIAGFAVIQDTDGLYYATQDFVQPSGATPAPARPAGSAPPPGRDDAPAPVPTVPVVPETAAEQAPQRSSDRVGPVVGSSSTLGRVDRPEDTTEVAYGRVAGLISDLPISTPSAQPAWPVGLAMVTLAAAVAGQGWWWARVRLA